MPIARPASSRSTGRTATRRRSTRFPFDGSARALTAEARRACRAGSIPPQRSPRSRPGWWTPTWSARTPWRLSGPMGTARATTRSCSCATVVRASSVSPSADEAGAGPQEVELKLTVLDAGATRDLIRAPVAGLPGVTPVGSARSIEIEARYVNTAGGTLRAAGLAARIRTSPDARRLTVKSLARRGGGAIHRRPELEGDAGG